MVKTRMRSMDLGVVALLGACVVSCAVLAADNPNVIVHDAWVRVPAPSKTDTAAYMVIENKSASARSVISASSNDAAKVELHEMKVMSPGKMDAKDGMSSMSKDNDGMSGMSKGADKEKEPGGSMMSMMPVAKIEVPANSRVSLAPNGYHLMLFGLKSKLSAGSKVKVTLQLDDGSTVPVTASARASE